MKRTVCLTCLLTVLMSTALYAQTMIPFQSGSAWGYKSSDGAVIAEAKYVSVSLPADGFGSFCLDVDGVLKWGVLASDGTEVIPAVFDYVDLCSEGMVAVYVGDVGEDEEYGMYMTEGRWGFVDLAAPSTDSIRFYSLVGPYMDGVAWADMSSRSSMRRLMRVMPVLDKKGRQVGRNVIFGVTGSFRMADMFVTDENGDVLYEDGEWVLVDRDGNMVSGHNGPYQAVGEFHDGLAWVKRGGLYGFVNAAGEEVIPVMFPMVQDAPGSHPASLLMRPEQGAVRWVMNGCGETAWLDENGQVVIDFTESDGRVSVSDKVDESMWDY